MPAFAIRAAAFGLLLSCLPLTHAAAAPRDTAETITIRVRPPYAICAGICPWFVTRVGPGGAVSSRTLALGSRGGIVPRRIYRFRVPARLSAFRLLLLPLRPVGERHADETCARAMLDGAPDPLDNPRPDDIDIRWSGGGRAARLTACAGNHMVRDRLGQALLELRLNPSGDRCVAGPPPANEADADRLYEKLRPCPDLADRRVLP